MKADKTKTIVPAGIPLAEIHSAQSLKKVLGVVFGVAIVVGSTIGSGILVNPGSIAAMLPNYWVICGCWLLCGLFILFSASSYAELNVLIPKEGGPYNYVKQAFGNYPSFIIGWFECMNNTVAPAFFCFAIARFVKLLFPSFPLSNAVTGVATLAIVTGINLTGVKAGSRFQELTSFIKVLLFVLLVAACFLYGNPANINAAGSKPFADMITSTGYFFLFINTFQLIIGTYSGWWGVSFFAEEDANPSKNVPRSYFLGIVIIMAVYVLVNAAIFYVVPMPVAAKSPLVAADAANIIFGKKGLVIITVFSILSLISTLNALVMTVPRILYGLGRDGFFIRQATKVNKGGSPFVSMLGAFAVQAVLIFISSFEELFKLAALSNVLITVFTLLSLIRLRKKWPHKERPYRAWGYPYTTVICLLIYSAFLIGFCFSDRKSAIIMLCIIILSLPLYFGLVKKNVAPQTTI